MAHESAEHRAEAADCGNYVDAEPLVSYTATQSDSHLDVGRTNRGAVLLPLVLTSITVTFTAGLAAALIAWLVTHHAVQGQTVGETLRTQRAFIVNEGTKAGGSEARLIGLTISSIASSLIGITIPFVMTLYAYRVASTWIAASNPSKMPFSDGALPTPLQYGLIFRLLGASSFMSLFDCSTYLFRKRRPTLPGTLINSFLVCACVFTVAHLVSLTDIWVHSSTHAILGANFTSQAPPGDMSLVFNVSLCDGSSPSSPYPGPCLQGTDSWDGGAPRLTGTLIAANVSDLAKVVTLSDNEDTALIVPTTVSAGIRFNATSFASRATCTSLNPHCQLTNAYVTSCANVGRPELPAWQPRSISQNTAYHFVYPIINGSVRFQKNSIDIQPLSLVTNPFDLAIQLRWATQAQDADLAFLNNAVDLDNANGTMSLYAVCNFTFLNVSYAYAVNAFAITDEEIMNANASNVFWGPLLAQLATDRLASNVQATAQAVSDADSVIALLRQELSRLALGMMGGTLLPSSAQVQQEVVTTKTLGRYDAVPVLILVLLLFLYALFAVCIFSLTLFTRAPPLPPNLRRASGDGKRPAASQLDLAHARLTNPLPLVADLFRPSVPSLAARLSVANNSMEMFEESAETARLVIGLQEGRFPAYGVRRRFEYEVEDKDE